MGIPFLKNVNSQPNARDLRAFARAMVIGFALLGSLAACCGAGVGIASVILWGTGLMLAIAAFIPKVGRIAYLSVYLPTGVVGYLVNRVVMTLIFFLVFTPVSIFLKLVGKDLLQHKRRREKTKWMAVKALNSEDRYYRQF